MSKAIIRAAAGQAKQAGISTKVMERLLVLKAYACPELLQVAHSGQLAPKHCEIVARALNHHDQRLFLASLPTLTAKQKHDALSAMRLHLQTKHHKPKAPKAKAAAPVGSSKGL